MTQNELENLMPRKVKEVCCKSYLTPKGQCYSCPEREISNLSEDVCGDQD